MKKDLWNHLEKFPSVSFLLFHVSFSFFFGHPVTSGDRHRRGGRRDSNQAFYDVLSKAKLDVSLSFNG